MLTTLDLAFLGHSRVIAAGLLHGSGPEVALVDPGPASSLDGLKAALGQQGLALSDVGAILLTHIHLDHAGVTGRLVADHPRIRVFVHERGAAHLIDPSKLMASAARIYGAQMDRLWGQMVPVPEQNVQVLRGGECIRAAGRDLQVAYTPGHAWHHVSYFDPATRTALAGDTGGIRLPGSALVLPPTPPPDIDLEAWDESIGRLLAWQPERVFVTHFGAFADASAHLAELRRRMAEWASLAAASLAEGATTDEQRRTRFADAVRVSVAQAVGKDAAEAYNLAVPFEDCWSGLARYFRKRAAHS